MLQLLDLSPLLLNFIIWLLILYMQQVFAEETVTGAHIVAAAQDALSKHFERASYRQQGPPSISSMRMQQQAKRLDMLLTRY